MSMWVIKDIMGQYVHEQGGDYTDDINNAKLFKTQAKADEDIDAAGAFEEESSVEVVRVKRMVEITVTEEV